jgi:type IV secretion system protein VirB6
MSCEDGTLLQFVLLLLRGVLDAKYLDALSNATFYCSVREYVINTTLIGSYRDNLAASLAQVVGYLSMVVITIWVMFQGFMVISGANRPVYLSLLFKTGKLVLIMALVTSIASKSPDIANVVLDFQRLITTVVVGEDANVYKMIDINLALTQVINQVIESMVGGAQVGAQGNTLTTVAGLIGQSGPAMITSVMAMIAEIAIVFSIILAPLFIFLLLFEKTAALFWGWAKFLVATFFSLAALALVSSIALKVTATYGATVLAAYYLNGSALGSAASFDMSGSAMRMAALGGLMSAIVVAVPPMIMQFFNASLSFAGSAMGGMAGGAVAQRMGIGQGGPSGAASGNHYQNQMLTPPHAADQSGAAYGASNFSHALANQGNMAAANNLTLLAQANNHASSPVGLGGGSMRMPSIGLASGHHAAASPQVQGSPARAGAVAPLGQVPGSSPSSGSGLRSEPVPAQMGPTSVNAPALGLAHDHSPVVPSARLYVQGGFNDPSVARPAMPSAPQAAAGLAVPQGAQMPHAPSGPPASQMVGAASVPSAHAQQVVNASARMADSMHAGLQVPRAVRPGGEPLR